MILKKKKLHEILASINENEFVPFFNKLGFNYKKTTKRFIKKKGKLDLSVSHMLNPSENYKIDDDGNFFLISDLSCAINTNDFRKWHQKYFNSSWNFNYPVGKILFYFHITQDKFNREDFSIGSQANLFKGSLSKMIRGGQQEPIFFDISEGLRYWKSKYYDFMELNSTWDFIWNNRRNNERLNSNSLHLLIYLKRMEEAKIGYHEVMKSFIQNLKKQNVANLTSWRIREYKDWIIQMEKEYNYYFHE